jgi:integrase
MGNWLTREQAKEILAVPDRSTLKGKRDYVILALLIGCALRRRELASLYIEMIQMREGMGLGGYLTIFSLIKTRRSRWVIADLLGKGGRIRTVAVPVWVKQGFDAWITAAGMEKGRLLRSIRKDGRIGDGLSDSAI